MVSIETLRTKPEKTKRLILYSVVSGIMLLVICGWIIFMKGTNETIKPSSESTNKVQEDFKELGSILKNTDTGITNTKSTTRGFVGYDESNPYYQEQ